MEDKRVWVRWMELRQHGDVEAIKTPVGFIPKYPDLARLFKEILGRDYTSAEYEEQFTTRVPKLLAKIERIEKVYKADTSELPPELFQELEAQKKRLEEARAKHGDNISPYTLEKA